MIGYPYGTLITGLMFVMAACLTLIRHWVLEPATPEYPHAPPFLRHAMFGFAAVVAFIGLHYIWVFFSGAPYRVPPQPEPHTQLLAFAMVIYKAMMLYNVMQQHYSKDAWHKLNELNDCLRKTKPSLVERITGHP